MQPDIHKPFWSLSTTETLSALGSREDGLSDAEAAARRAAFGSNTLTQKEKLTGLKIFIRQFKSPLIIILLVAAGITIALGDFTDAAFVLLAALVNTGLGYYQESKAEKALSHLESYVTRTVRVERGGGEREVDTASLVPGDIIHLSQGARVPADARLLYSSEVQVDQAILTGESLAVDKKTEAVTAEAILPDRSNMLYSGTLVVSGFGEAVVTATGAATELGKIAELVGKQEEDRTPLQRALEQFTKKAAVFIFILAGAVFAISYSSGVPLLESFLIAVATLVAAVPEGLPIVMTVILAIGVERLARKKGVVRKLSAAETLGSTSVILTDKTGTLTQAKMQLSAIHVFAEPRGLHKNERDEDFLLQTALLNVDAIVENPGDPVDAWRVLGKPVEAAIVMGAGVRGLDALGAKKSLRPLHILPFNSLNKFSASIYKLPETYSKGKFSASAPHVISMLGAPDILLQYCDLSLTQRTAIEATIKEMALRGERVLGVAVKELDTDDGVHLRDKTHLHGLKFLGTLSMRDPIRPGVKQALSEVEQAGIRVVIVTGDHSGTAVAVGSEIGMIISPDQVLEGTVIEKMTDAELIQAVGSVRIISRISPVGKLRVVKAFQARKEIVAMNGDGINDAPALKEANIGVAMGTGTDVSKDVADLVLLDDNFETIVEAIKEGRRIVHNIRKGIVYLSSTILNETFLIGGSLLFGVPVPITALQILWVNFFTDSLPGISLAFEDRIDSLRQQPEPLSRGIFTQQMKILITVNGLISSILLLCLYVWLLNMGHDAKTVQTFIFAAFSTYSLFLIFAVRSLHRSIFSYNPFSNGYLVASVLFGIILTIGAVSLPFLQNLFGTVSLSSGWILGVIGFGFLNILIVEATKAAFIEKLPTSLAQDKTNN